DRQPERGKLLQPPPGPRDALLLLGHEGRVKRLLGEEALAAERLEGGVHDVLGGRGVAADGPLAHRGQRPPRHLSDHGAQSKVGAAAPPDARPADVAKVALFAPGHRQPSAYAARRPPAPLRLAGALSASNPPPGARRNP